ncbi:MAG: hypothetical protein R3A78_14030 [Polyangiales bacterium]|nr:hypothetical protein [Myxococcales bacterium]
MEKQTPSGPTGPDDGGIWTNEEREAAGRRAKKLVLAFVVGLISFVAFVLLTAHE